MGCIGDKQQKDGTKSSGGEETKQREKSSFKVVLVGESDVGKSSLIHRYTSGMFPGPATEVDYATKTIDVDGREVTISVFDTQGMEKFKTITSSFYDGSGGILLVYDISSYSTFDVLSTWFAECERYAKESELILVGNKSDLTERQVTKEQLEKLALAKGIAFQEVSAKSGDGVDLAFEKLVRLMLGLDPLGGYAESESEPMNGKSKKKKQSGESDEE